MRLLLVSSSAVGFDLRGDDDDSIDQGLLACLFKMALLFLHFILCVLTDVEI